MCFISKRLFFLLVFSWLPNVQADFLQRSKAVFSGSTHTFQFPLPTMFDAYQWTDPEGAQIRNQDTNSSVGGDETATVERASRKPHPSRRAVTIKTPTQPAAIRGATKTCTGERTIYTIDAVSGTEFDWRVTGGTIISASDTPTIEVYWQRQGRRRVTVTLQNAGKSRTTNLHVTVTRTPNLEGETTVIAGVPYVYSLNTRVNQLTDLIVIHGSHTTQNRTVTVVWGNTGEPGQITVVRGNCATTLNVTVAAPDCDSILIAMDEQLSDLLREVDHWQATHTASENPARMLRALTSLQQDLSTNAAQLVERWNQFSRRYCSNSEPTGEITAADFLCEGAQAVLQNFAILNTNCGLAGRQDRRPRNGAHWVPVFTGDFDGDDQDDLVWFHPGQARYALKLGANPFRLIRLHLTADGLVPFNEEHSLTGPKNQLLSETLPAQGYDEFDIAFINMQGLAENRLFLLDALPDSDLNGDSVENMLGFMSWDGLVFELDENLIPIPTTIVTGPDRPWRLQTVEDINGDGWDDLVWLDKTKQVRIIYFLQNERVIGSREYALKP